MQNSERTTVILPTFNRSTYLVEALESLLSQTLPAAEIIVADDGSTDDTPERMARYGGVVRYIRKANSGKADTLNQCLELAQNPLIWIMDDDDLALPNALRSMTDRLSGRPEVGFVYGAYQRFDLNDEGEINRRDCGYWRDVDDDGFLPATLEDFFVHHPGMLVRRAAYEDVGPFSTRYGRTEDYEMLIRLARRHACVKTPDVVFLQRQHDGARFAGLAAHHRNQRWIEEGAAIFTNVHADLALHEYLPISERRTPLSPALQRRALITRGAIMARHKLWPLAFDDFRAACGIGEVQGPLAEVERSAVRGALFSKFGSAEILSDPEIARGLRILAGEGRVGRSIARTFARALVWLIRTRAQTGRISEAARYAKLSVSLALQ